MVQEPSVATPLALVVACAPVRTDPAIGASKVTACPAIGLPNPSVTRTDGGMPTGRVTTANWKASVTGKIVAAAPIWPVAEMETAGRLVTVSVSVWVPTLEPRVQRISPWPLVPVVTDVGAADPPPTDSVVAVT